MVNRSDIRQRKVRVGHSCLTNRISRGQSAVEFALISGLALMVMLVGLQFAMIGQAALALSQGASALARYVAVNEALGTVSPSFNGKPTTAMKNLLSSSILTNGGNDLTVTVSSLKGGTTGTAATTPVATVDRAIVTLSYVTANKIALPNPFLGVVHFPTTLTASDAQVYE